MFYYSVTEVVWEGEETEVKTEAKKADTVTTKKSDNNASINPVNRLGYYPLSFKHLN